MNFKKFVGDQCMRGVRVYPYYVKDLDGKPKLQFYYRLCYKGDKLLRRGFTSEAQALSAAALHYENLTLGVTEKKQKKWTINELIPLYLSHLEKEYRDTTAYTHVLTFNKYIKPHLERLSVDNISNLTLSKLIMQFERVNLSNKTKLIAALKLFLDFLTKYGLDKNLDYSILKIKNVPLKKTNKQSFWSHEEFLSFIAAVKNTDHKLLFSLLFYYGLRIGELRGLKHQDIDTMNDLVFIERSITNKTGKGHQVESILKTNSSNRVYPLTKEIKALYLLLDKKTNSEDYLFKSENKNSLVIGETSIRRILDEYTKAVNLKRIKIHDFRRSSNLYLKSLGFDKYDRAAWLGHSNPNVTDTYYTPTDEDLKSKIKLKIDASDT